MEVREPSAQYLLPPGYKQTEVGVIPEDWEVVPLYTLADRIMVGIASAATHAYRDSGVVMFRNQNIKAGYLDDNEVLYIAKDYESAFRNKRLKAGDLLTARTGYPGTTSIVPKRYEGAQSFTTLITRPRLDSIDSEFLCYFINSAFGQKYFEQAQIGGGQKNVNAGALKNLPVCLPSTVEEQQAIAEALSDADALIEAQEQLLAKKRQIKQGAMQELLTGQRRLPGFEGEWQEVLLVEWGECHRGVSYNPAIDLFPMDAGNTARLLRSNNVQEAVVVFSDFQYVDTRRVVPDQYLQNGDVLICMANGSRDLVGKSGKFSRNDGYRYTFGAFMGCFRPDPQKVDSNYAFYVFQTEAYRKHIALLLAGSSINNLTPKNVESFALVAPLDRDEQTAIATVLSDMDEEITALETKLAKARAIKQGMMQALLIGRIRLV